jgi:transposase
MNAEELKTLQSFINSRPDSRELARALAVKLAKEGYAYRAISQILQVSSGFITKWKKAFDSEGIQGIKLGYQGRKRYLESQQREEIINWIIAQKTWSVSEVERELMERYDVVYKSLQSYYELLNEAQKTWQKSQRTHPRQDAEQVKKKRRNRPVTGRGRTRNKR